jgi:hypothetical protein
MSLIFWLRTSAQQTQEPPIPGTAPKILVAVNAILIPVVVRDSLGHHWQSD